MSITLTFFKKVGSTKSDNFYGNGHAGSAKGEWKLLIADKKLRDTKVKILVIEYDNAKHLPSGYEKKVTWSPYLDLRYGDDAANSVHFPQKASYDRKRVFDWASQVIDHMTSTNGSTTEVITTSVATVVDTSKSASTTAKTASNWVAPVALAVGGIALTAAIIVGTGADKKIKEMYRDYHDLDDEEEVEFFNGNGDKVKNRNLSWAEVESNDSLL